MALDISLLAEKPLPESDEQLRAEIAELNEAIARPETADPADALEIRFVLNNRRIFLVTLLQTLEKRRKEKVAVLRPFSDLAGVARGSVESLSRVLSPLDRMDEEDMNRVLADPVAREALFKKLRALGVPVSAE